MRRAQSTLRNAQSANRGLAKQRVPIQGRQAAQGNTMRSRQPVEVRRKPAPAPRSPPKKKSGGGGGGGWGFFKKVGSKIGSGFKSVGSKIGSGFKSAGSKIGSGFKKVGSKIGSGFKKVGSKIGSGFKSVGSKAGSFFKKVGSKIGNGIKTGINKGLNAGCEASKKICLKGCQGVRAIGKGAVSLGTAVATKTMSLSKKALAGLTKVVEDIFTGFDLKIAIAGSLDPEEFNFMTEFSFRFGSVSKSFKLTVRCF
jgi:hypothetical protein